MSGKVLFLIIGNEVKYLQNSPMDHREWYASLGYDLNLFENVVRGFVEGNRIIFYKGSSFQYDEEVISAARKFTPNIRYTCSNPSLEVYCGIYFQPGSKWEPILKINENEITGFVSTPIKEEKVPHAAMETGPILELKNDYDDKQFLKKATIVTSIVLVLTLIIKILLFQKKVVLNLQNATDVLLAFGQIALLGATIFGYLKKKSFAKYSGIMASLLIIFTLDIYDVIIGILYFLFCIDHNYFVKSIDFVKKLLNSKNQNKSS